MNHLLSLVLLFVDAEETYNLTKVLIVKQTSFFDWDSPSEIDIETDGGSFGELGLEIVILMFVTQLVNHLN